ncbi:MAG: hypothetical protein M1840_007241 [Geoglossum simile]|nr:MAG: hypothetical protein M1840_007241 [Geoglossum simile]
MSAEVVGQQHGPGLRLLALDGGGIRGISELIILSELMLKIKRAQSLDHTPTPAETFDLIGGTSTGGLIALLLGRLGLSAQEAIDEYVGLAGKVFSERKSKGKDGIFKAKRLEEAIQDVVRRKGRPNGERDSADPNMRVLEQVASPGTCKMFVCSKNAKNMAIPRLFRSYDSDSVGQYSDMTIWQAGRATSAAPTFFKRLRIGPENYEEEFIDGGVGTNNPTKELIAEATRVFGQHRRISCILSIGAGKTDIIEFTTSGILASFLPLKLVKALRGMATDAESVAREQEEKYQNTPGVYYRFNVEQGLQDIDLDEWKRLGDVKAHTISYLAEPAVSRKLDDAAVALSKKTASFSGGDNIVVGLGAPIPSELLSAHGDNIPVRHTSIFVGRGDILQKIDDELSSPPALLRSNIVVLVGMGGQGKTQIALEYCARAKRDHRYSSIFWADAGYLNVLTRSFDQMAEKLRKPPSDTRSNVDYVMGILEDREFLLVLDNYDNPRELDITEFIPRSQKGAVIITSRDTSCARIGKKIDVGCMVELEAVELLSVQSGMETENNEEAILVVQLLGYLPLGIDQAAAFIRKRNLPFADFIVQFKKRKELLLEVPLFWDYKKRVKEGDVDAVKSLGVFTTFELSFSLLGADEEDRRCKGHLLTLSAFLGSGNISQAFFVPWFKSSGVDYGVSLFGEPYFDWVAPFITENGILDPHRFSDFIAESFNLSLLQSQSHDERGTCYSMHSLVGEWLRFRVDGKKREAYTTEAIMIAEAYLDSSGNESRSIEMTAEISEHIRACLQNNDQFLSTTNKRGTLSWCPSSNSIPCFLAEQGQYRIAEPLCRIHLEFMQKHPLLKPVVARSHGLLGVVCLGVEKFEEAASHLVLALSGYTEFPGSFTKEEIQELFVRLCDAYLKQGASKDAKTLVVSGLARYEICAGHDPTEIGEWMASITDLCLDEIRYEDMEDILEEFLEVWRFEDGIAETPRTSLVVYNLARLCFFQNKFDEASQLFSRAMRGFEDSFGKNGFYPYTLRGMTYLIVIHHIQGKRDIRSSYDATGQFVQISKANMGDEQYRTVVCSYIPGVKTVGGSLKVEFSRSFWIMLETLNQKFLPFRYVTPSTTEPISTLEAAIIKAYMALHTHRNLAEEEAEFRESIDRHQRVFGNNGGTLICAKTVLVGFMMVGDRFAEALAAIEELLEVQLRLNSPDLQNTVKLKARVYSRLNRNADIAALKEQYPTIDWVQWRKEGDAGE